MIIRVKAYPNSKKEEIIGKDKNKFFIFVKEKAKNNEANFRIFQILADHFQIPQSRIRMRSGAKKPSKIFEI